MDCHSEWRSVSDRDGEMSYDISYMHNLKRNETNEHAYKTERLTGLEKEFMVARERADGGRDS